MFYYDSTEIVFDRLNKEERPILWPLPFGLEQSPAVAFRNRCGRALGEKGAPEIIASNSAPVYLSMPDLQSIFSPVSKQLLKKPLSGFGIELGAGCGMLSSYVAKSPDVKSVLALEVCRDFAKYVIPKVALWILGPNADKVIPVVGTFDDIQLPDNSLDFAIEINSLHHSNDLIATLKEVARVLKPKGRLLCFEDRVHDDVVTDEMVQQALSIVYSEAFLINHNYPLDVNLTRRENGEHEYRYFEWKSAFADAGFILDGRLDLTRPVCFTDAAKGALSVLPMRVRRLLYKSDLSKQQRILIGFPPSHTPPGPKTTLRWVSQRLRAAVGRTQRDPDFACKEITAFLLTKAT
jgi:SAM-dependent methyltransferase